MFKVLWLGDDGNFEFQVCVYTEKLIFDNGFEIVFVLKMAVAWLGGLAH